MALPTFDIKDWVTEVNPLGPPADPEDATPIGGDDLKDLEERIAAHVAAVAAALHPTVVAVKTLEATTSTTKLPDLTQYGMTDILVKHATTIVGPDGGFPAGTQHLIRLRQHSAGPYIVEWDEDDFDWSFGPEPQLTSASEAKDVVGVVSFDGALLYGLPGGYDFK